MKRYGFVGGALALASMLGVQTITLAAPPEAGPSPSHRDDPGFRRHFSRSLRWGDPEPRARLGLVPIAISPELRTHLGAPPDRGVLVDQVLPGGAAAKAGLKTGDVLTVVAGRPVTNRADIIMALGELGAQTIVNVIVVRGGTPLPLVATLPKPEAAAARNREGDAPGDDGAFDDGAWGLEADPRRLDALEKRLEALETQRDTH